MSQTVGMTSHAEHSSTGLPHRKLMMWAFLASDCMLFGALMATYLLYHGTSQQGPYPLDVFDLELTSLSTFVLLMSSLTMGLTLATLQRGSVTHCRFWLLMTVLFGATFLGFQVHEFSTFAQAGLRLRGSTFGSTFYTLTGMPVCWTHFFI